jgi:hypothetical protein
VRVSLRLPVTPSPCPHNVRVHHWPERDTLVVTVCAAGSPTYPPPLREQPCPDFQSARLLAESIVRIAREPKAR